MTNAFRLIFVYLMVFGTALAIANAASASPSASLSPSQSISLGLDGYLTQVSEKNSAFRAARQNSRAAQLSSLETRLIYHPVFEGRVQAFTEGKQLPFNSGDRFGNRFYSLGIAQATPIGLNLKLSYNRSQTDVPALQNPFGQPIHYDPKWF